MKIPDGKRVEVEILGQSEMDIVNRLIGAVDLDNERADEYNVIADLIARSGMGWRCIRHECRCVNFNISAKCDSCNARRPLKREIPQPESMVGVSLEYERWAKRREQNKLNRANSPKETD